MSISLDLNFFIIYYICYPSLLTLSRSLKIPDFKKSEIFNYNKLTQRDLLNFF